MSQDPMSQDPAAPDGTAPDVTAPTWVLERFPEQIAVVRLAPGAEIPQWAESSSVFSITATAQETSLVCAARSVPGKVRKHGPLTAFSVRGPLDPALTGVLAGLLTILADALIPVFALSTYDTDWLLVPRGRADAAAAAWAAAGHEVLDAVPAQPGRS